MKKLIALSLVPIIGAIILQSIILHQAFTITKEREMIKEYHKTIYNLRLIANDTYNEGYRAGKLEGVAELVECDHVTDINVLRMYENMSNILRDHNELDEAPFPCTK